MHFLLAAQLITKLVTKTQYSIYSEQFTVSLTIIRLSEFFWQVTLHMIILDGCSFVGLIPARRLSANPPSTCVMERIFLYLTV